MWYLLKYAYIYLYIYLLYFYKDKLWDGFRCQWTLNSDLKSNQILHISKDYFLFFDPTNYQKYKWSVNTRKKYSKFSILSVSYPENMATIVKLDKMPKLFLILFLYGLQNYIFFNQNKLLFHWKIIKCLEIQ